jgi:hypothetical protein
MNQIYKVSQIILFTLCFSLVMLKSTLKSETIDAHNRAFYERKSLYFDCLFGVFSLLNQNC